MTDQALRATLDPTQTRRSEEPLRGLEQYRLEWLISFVASARHGGVSAAARALYRSQPRVSSHVADLEQALGVQLFDRSARPVRLTSDGHTVLHQAESILDALRTLSESVAGSSPRLLRLAAETSAATYIYPILAKSVSRVLPSTRLVLDESVDRVDLTADTWDLALAPATFDSRMLGIDSQALWVEPLVAVLKPDHELARDGVNLMLSSLGGVSLINQHINHYAASTRLNELDVVAQTALPTTMISMVRHGMGVGLLSGLAAMSANCDGVVLKPLNDPHCQRTISLWWRRRNLGRDENILRQVASSVSEPVWPWMAQGRYAATAV